MGKPSKISSYKIAKQKNGKGYYADITIVVRELFQAEQSNVFLHKWISDIKNHWLEKFSVYETEEKRVNDYNKMIEKGINLCCFHYSIRPCEIEIVSFDWNPVDTTNDIAFLVAYKAMEIIANPVAPSIHAPYFNEVSMTVEIPN